MLEPKRLTSQLRTEFPAPEGMLYLILAQERQVKKNLNGLGIGGHDDELGNTTVEGLGGLVSTLLELLVVRSLLDQVHDGVGKSGIGKGPGFGVDFGLKKFKLKKKRFEG